MVAKKKTVDASKPEDFDFAGWLSGVKPARFTAPLFRRADLVPRMDELKAKIDRSGKTEFSVGEGDPTAKAVVEYNKLVDQFERSREDFVFRPQNSEDGSKVLAELSTDNLTEASEAAPSYMMAQTCVSHPMTGAQMQQLRETVGELAFSMLAEAWGKAWQFGGERDAPFSPLPLPTPNIEA